LRNDPLRFQNDPEQFSGGPCVRVWNTGQVTAQPHGQRDGMQRWLELLVGEDR
jgi:hypothetical protein